MRILHFIKVSLLCVLTISLTYLATQLSLSFDLTENSRHSLTRGSIELLTKLERPVTIRYYLSKSQNLLPVDLRNYSERVDDFLESVIRESHGKIILERLDPKPYSDDEQSALLDGMQGQRISADTSFYMGMSISSAGSRKNIPFLMPENEGSLEYAVISKIQQVTTKDKPTLGVISELPITGSSKVNPWGLIALLSDSHI